MAQQGGFVPHGFPYNERPLDNARDQFESGYFSVRIGYIMVDDDGHGREIREKEDDMGCVYIMVDYIRSYDPFDTNICPPCSPLERAVKCVAATVAVRVTSQYIRISLELFTAVRLSRARRADKSTNQMSNVSSVTQDSKTRSPAHGESEAMRVCRSPSFLRIHLLSQK